MDFVLRDRRDLFMELSAIAAMAKVSNHLGSYKSSKQENKKTNVAKKKKRKIAEASKVKNRRKK